jgi:hypothetical protein
MISLTEIENGIVLVSERNSNGTYHRYAVEKGDSLDNLHPEVVEFVTNVWKNH